MTDVQARIDAWERDGLIDGATAGRLRQAEATASALASTQPVDPPPVVASPSRRGRIELGPAGEPAVSAGEMFAWLGVIFVLAAWTTFVTRLAGENLGSTIVAGGFAIAAVGLLVFGVVLRSGSARRRRAAGPALVVAAAYVAAAAAPIVNDAFTDTQVRVLLVAIIALAATAAARRIQPGLATQLGVLIAITTAGAALIAWGQSLLPYRDFDLTSQTSPDPRAGGLIAAFGWLATGLILGLLAIVEERSGPGPREDDGAPERRAGLTRLWAGLTAVGGFASAVTQQTYTEFGPSRIVEPWLADALILAVALFLVQRAFLRDSGAFLLAAGVGFVIALTDFNFSYLSTSTEIGLLIEGGILLAVGVVADRLRRRLTGTDGALPPPSENAAD